MMAFRTIALSNIMEVRQEVARVLIQQLGITKAAFYFRENFAQQKS